MTERDFEEFAKLLGAVAEVYNEPLSPVRIRLYFDALREYSLEEVRRAFKELVRTSDFFPRPAAVVRTIEGEGESGQLIWLALLRMLEGHGYWDSVKLPKEIAQLIRMRFGGWIEFSQLTRQELRRLEREMVPLLDRVARKLSGETEVLHGQHDLNNIRNGYTDALQRPVDFTTFIEQVKVLSQPGQIPPLPRAAGERR